MNRDDWLIQPSVNLALCGYWYRWKIFVYWMGSEVATSPGVNCLPAIAVRQAVHAVGINGNEEEKGNESRGDIFRDARQAKEIFMRH
jgi:hypothetical protein